nr:hypothetical protein [Tanacetum cinerariifolium]
MKSRVVNYDQHAYFGTSYWGPKHKTFYGYTSDLTSSKDVYSRRRIIAVTRLTIIKKYDYDHLEEIEVHQDDQQLYTFKEDQFKRKRLMHTDELYKFSDGMLNDVWTTRHDIAMGIRMEYLPMRKWSNLDKKRARTLRGRPTAAEKDHMIYHMLFSYFSQNRRDLPRDIPLDSVEFLRVLRIILVILPEHQSDMKVITMKMEILLDPTSNKLLVERFNNSVGNLVKDIRLKLNLPDHRILKDGGEGT